MHKRKIAITGHTSGIGKAIFDQLKEVGHEVLGFSRSTGHDITSKDGIAAILREVNDCSVFINNASQDWAQLDLLYDLFSIWKDSEKLIINMGSISGDGNKDRAYKYAIEKSALDKATAQLNNIWDAKCRVTTVRPGWVKTPRIEHLNVQGVVLSSSEVAEVILWIMNMPPHIHVPNLTLIARK